MRALFATLIAVLMSSATIWGQARVQTIHTVIDPAVDVYVNNILVLDNFDFRDATEFGDVPGGLPLNIAVAPGNSMSANEAIFTTTQTFVSGRTYCAFVKGDVNDPMSLEYIVDENAQEVANDPAKVDISLFHASPDAPAVDVAVRQGPTLFSDVEYAEFTPYVGVDPGEYLLDIKPAGTNTVVATYRADVSGLTGQAIRVFASGFLSGNDPSFSVFVALNDGTVLELERVAFARAQVIHNSPNASPVDVYVNGDLALDDFVFQTATPYIDVPANGPLNIGFAPPTSTSVNDTIANFDYSGLPEGATFLLNAVGLFGSPDVPLNLTAAIDAREQADDPAKVDFSVSNGAIEFVGGTLYVPSDISVTVVGEDQSPFPNSDIAGFGNPLETGYASVDPGTYRLLIEDANTNAVLGRFELDLSGRTGEAVNVFASGVINDPDPNAPEFGLFAAFSDGTVEPLPAYSPTSRVQIIHNSPSPTVDIWVNGTKALGNFEYRTSTGFIDLPAETLLDVGIAVAGSTTVDDTIANFQVTFDELKTYTVIAHGIVGDPTTPFTLFVDDNSFETSAGPNTTVIDFFHGVTDAPAVDLDPFAGPVEGATPFGTLSFENISYGENNGIINFATDILDEVRFRFTAAGDDAVIARYIADFSNRGGQGVYLFASGLLAGSPDFGLFAAFPDGTVEQLATYDPVARVQVIHNSADPVVDIYVNGNLAIDSFAYRTATPFIDLPAETQLNIGVAAYPSTSVDDTIANFQVTLAEFQRYIVTAIGIVGDPTTPFTLNVNPMALEANLIDTTQVALAALHGATNAPAVDVVEVTGPTTLFPDLEYGEFSDYIVVPENEYTLGVNLAGTQDEVARFTADLNGLRGGVAYVFASGLVGGDPNFGLFAALPNGDVVELPQILPSARLQVIHNSPSPTVDVYVNGQLAIDSFVYRTATPFFDIDAETTLNIGVAAHPSTSVDDTLVNFQVFFEEGETYIVTASGIVGDPTTPFTLIVNDMGRETAATAGNVEIAVLHGATDAPAVDVDELLTGNVIPNLSYGEFTPYLSLPPAVYDFGIRATGSPDYVAAFRADLSGLADGAAYVFASGLLAGSPDFGLFAALADGTVLELPATPTTRVQIIHNSPSPFVDVYANAVRLIDNFEYRTATPYIDVPADRPVVIGVADSSSTSASDAIVQFPVTFPADDTLVVYAGGIVGDPTTPFDLFISQSAEVAANPANVEFAVHHGATNAPAVDVDIIGLGNIIDSLNYSEFTTLFAAAPNDYLLAVRPNGSPDRVGIFVAPLTGLDGVALQVFASGLLGDDPQFGLFAALPDGTVIELPSVAFAQVIHNSPSPTVDVYIDGDLALDNFEFREATNFGLFDTDRVTNIGIALDNSTSVNDTIVNFEVQPARGQSYYAVVNGIAGDPTTPLTLDLYENARIAANDPAAFEFAVLHGSPNAPNVDVVNFFDGSDVLTDVAYRDITPGYLAINPGVLFLDIETNVGAQLVGTWGGNFSSFDNTVGLIFASGLVGDNFDLWIALPDGTTFALPDWARVQAIHNSPEPTVDLYIGNQLFEDNFEFRNATGIFLAPAGPDVVVSVAPEGSTSVSDTIYSVTVNNLVTGRLYTAMAGGVVGDPTTPFQIYFNEGRDRAIDPTQVALNLFHGSPDAPGVDVVAQGAGVIFDDVEFGNFAPYVEVAPTEYLLDLTPADDNNNALVTYRADISGLGSQSATVFASGFFGGGTPGFETWVALTDGTTFPLPVVVSTNDLDDKLSSLSLAPNPATDYLLMNLDVTEEVELRYGVRDVAGRLMIEGDLGNVNGALIERINTSTLPAGLYQLELVSESGVRAVKFAVQR